MSFILVAYNNCAETFESSQLNSNSSQPNTKESTNSIYNFDLLDQQQINYSFKGQFQRLSATFTDNNLMAIPNVSAEGFLCSPDINDELKIAIVRRFETNTSVDLIEESRKHYLRSEPIELTEVQSRLIEQECSNSKSGFSINQSLDDLQINRNMLNNDETYIHNDYFYIEVVHNKLKTTNLNSPLLNKLPGDVFSLNPFSTENPVQIGVWGKWQEKKVGSCDNGKQTYELTRDCLNGLQCKDSNNTLTTSEAKREERNCTPPQQLGTWGNWNEKKVGSCTNGKQTYELERTCKNNLVCKKENNEIAKTEKKTEQRNCTPPNSNYNPPDVVNGIPTPRKRTNWSDSYSVDGQCYCDTTNFDHGLDKKYANTPRGRKKVTEICQDVKNKFGSGRKNGRVYFNDIQCGNGPANDAADEKVCPGIPNRNKYSGSRCKEKGSTWNLDQVYN